MLSQYIKDTGDLDGVMDFLRTMVSSGKLSEADGLSYIARVINNLETIKTPYNHHEVEPAQALRHLIQANYQSEARTRSGSHCVIRRRRTRHGRTRRVTAPRTR